jgi:hypothetical protein
MLLSQAVSRPQGNGQWQYFDSPGADILSTIPGSEAGHATGEYSHGNGYKMDFQKNAGLDGYITSAFARIEDRFDGYAQYQAGSGNIYCVSNYCSLVFC